jgi:hypothetical protein
MGGGAKPIKQTAEEKALLRAQLLNISKQDEEIADRKRRILRGQYTNFGGLLKSGKSSAGIPFANPSSGVGETFAPPPVPRGRGPRGG